MSVRTDVLIPGHRKAVWAVLTDLPCYPRWNPFIRRLDGELREGARWRAELTLDGRVFFTVPVVVVRCVPNECLTWRGGPPGLMTGTHGFALTETTGGVRLEQRESFAGLLTPAILPLLRSALERRFVAMNEALRAEVARRGGLDVRP